MKNIKIGQKAPAFKTTDQDGNKIDLKDFKGKRVILYFYPKDNTPGCTKEACSLRDDFEYWSSNDTVILGVSKDSAKSHQNFIKKHALPFPLLMDEDLKIHEAYGVWGEKTLYGKQYMGTIRTTFVIDASGKIQAIIDKVDTAEHSQQLIDLLEN
jgi:peroxiredoxin Q/BCP